MLIYICQFNNLFVFPLNLGEQADRVEPASASLFQPGGAASESMDLEPEANEPTPAPVETNHEEVHMGEAGDEEPKPNPPLVAQDEEPYPLPEAEDEEPNPPCEAELEEPIVIEPEVPPNVPLEVEPEEPHPERFEKPNEPLEAAVEEPSEPIQVEGEELCPPLEDGATPPLVLRVEQWQQKPKAAAKGKAKAKASAKSKARASPKKKVAKAKAKAGGRRRKLDAEPVEIMASGDEGKDVPMDGSKSKKGRKPGSKAKAKAKAKLNPPATEPSSSNEPAEKKDPPIKYEPVTEHGKAEFEANCKGEGHDPVEEAPPSLQQEPKPNDSNEKAPSSFARRPMPFSSPAKERWVAIRDVFHSHLAPVITQEPFALPISSFQAGAYLNLHSLYMCHVHVCVCMRTRAPMCI